MVEAMILLGDFNFLAEPRSGLSAFENETRDFVAQKN